MNFMENMMEHDMKNLNKLIDSLHPKYICTQDYKDIKQGDMVAVEVGEYQVYITSGKSVYCTNEFVLSMHFEKIG